MNEEYIYDGEIHALNDYMAYAIRYIENDISIESADRNLNDLLNEFGKKYSDYVTKCGEDSVKKVLSSCVSISDHYRLTPTFIYRPSYTSNDGQKILPASAAIKFERLSNDGLECKKG